MLPIMIGLMLVLVIGLCGFIYWNVRHYRRLNRALESWVGWSGIERASPDQESQVLPTPAPPSLPSFPAFSFAQSISHRLRKIVKNQQDEYDHLRQQFSHFINAIQASPNGILLLSAEGHIQWCNEVSSNQLNIDRLRDRGAQITYLIRQPEFLSALANPQRNFDESPLIFSPLPQSPERLIQFKIIAFGSGQKLMLTQDVSHTQRLEKMRREFVANVSHEFKTPVTVLMSALENLRELPLSHDERALMMAQMQSQLIHMDRLINDLLILAKLESEPLLIKKTVQVSTMIEALIGYANLQSRGQHTFNSEAIDRHLALIGAPNEIESAVHNLINNAIRYSPSGGTITLRWQKTPPPCLVDFSAQGAFLSCQDEGLGIPAHAIHRLSERFFRVDTSRSTQSGGTGLGLSIVKQVMTRHEGELIIDSVEGQGSTFTLFFPQRRIADNTDEAIQSRS